MADDLACRDFVEMVTEYLEGALPPDLCASFEAHLEICDGCRIYLGQMRLTIRALREPGSGSAPLPVREELLHRFRAWRAERLPAPPHGRAAFHPGSGPPGDDPAGEHS